MVQMSVLCVTGVLMTRRRYVLQWALVVEDEPVNEQKFEDVEEPVITLEEAIVSEFIRIFWIKTGV